MLTGWEIKDLLGELKATSNGEDSPLNQFNLNYYPLSIMKQGIMLILREFQVNTWQNERRIMNTKPNLGDEKQWGITIIECDGSSGSMSSYCIPNHLNYQSIILGDSQQVTITTKEFNIKTNHIEIRRKLKSIYGLATEEEIAVAFNSLSNEQFVQPEKIKVIYQHIDNKILGALNYNATLDQYAGIYQIEGHLVNIYIDLVEVEVLMPLIDEVANMLNKHYYLLAMQAMLIPILELKNGSWLIDEDIPLTLEQIKQCIKITDIAFCSDGTSAIFCDDGDLFFGHCIVIQVDKEGNFIDVNIQG